MVLEKLGSSLKNTLSKIAGSVFVDEKLVNELVKEIQRALLQSDVNVSLVFDLSKKIKERILKDEIPAGLTKKEYLINVVYEELTDFLGSESKPINFENKPSKLMLVGLFGNGKTTSAGKIAKFYKKRGKKVAMISTDTWRPAAFKQLQQLGSQIDVKVFGNLELKSPVDIYKQFENELNDYDLVIVDTAGRDAMNQELTDELNEINSYIKPDETLLVMSADVGQAAQKQAEFFNEYSNVTGVVITKLDGTAKGGGALSACAVTGKKVLFIGIGEKIDDLELFEPKRFVGRLLGMGDMEGLLEKAKEAISEEDAKDMEKKFMKGKFNLVDLYQQMQAMKSMGSLGKIMEMVPGFSQLQLPKEMLDQQEGKLEIWKVLMDSCTKEELEEPEIISSTRIDRVCKGSGRKVSELRELLKQYKESKKMVKMMKGMGAGSPGQMKKLMSKFKGKLPGM